MSSRHGTAITGALVAAGCAALLVMAPQAGADDQGPGSPKGGKAIDPAPAGVKLTTTLPERISVDNSTRKTALTATVKNEGTKDSGKIRLLVVGFEGLSINSVEGCTQIPKENLPEGSNSGFNCPIDNLAAGATKSYAVNATYDLTKKGMICLPVQSPDGRKTYWQQGPVPFGSSNPSPNAPATPLLLGTDNKPVTPGADQLPSTGPSDALIPLGAAGTALLTAGAAGVWWSRRRPVK